MKVNLKFKLWEESEEFEDAYNGGKWKSIVRDFDERLRSIVKHGSKEGYSQKTVEGLRTELWDIVKDHDLNL